MSTPKAVPVAREVLEVLQRCHTDGNNLVLPEQLDRAMYVATNKVLEAAGGKWNRSAKAHVFPGPADEAMDAVLLTGTIARPQDFGFFETPREIVDQMIEEAQIEAGMSVLEPEAGCGAIAIPLSKITKNVMCIELQQKNAAQLVAAGIRSVVVMDFLTLEPTTSQFDRVVMNPPFAKRADVKHIMHAYRFLKPGGRLVSIASASVLFRDDKLALEFRKLVSDHGGTITPLPPGSFKASGTLVNTVMVVIPA